MSEDDEVIKKSKKPMIFPRRVGESNVVTIPKENLSAFDGTKPPRKILVNVFTMRGKDGKLYLAIKRVKV